MGQPWETSRPTGESLLGSARARRPDASALMGERLLMGWRMLAECCPDCSVRFPLSPNSQILLRPTATQISVIDQLGTFGGSDLLFCSTCLNLAKKRKRSLFSSSSSADKSLRPKVPLMAERNAPSSLCVSCEQEFHLPGQNESNQNQQDQTEPNTADNVLSYSNGSSERPAEPGFDALSAFRSMTESTSRHLPPYPYINGHQTQQGSTHLTSTNTSPSSDGLNTNSDPAVNRAPEILESNLMARETQLDDTEAESFSQYEQDHTARMRALMESISSSTVPEQITNQAGNYSMNDSPNLRFNPAQNSVQSLPNSSTSPQSPETIPNLQNPSATKMHEKPSDNSDMGPSNLNYQNGSAYDTRLSQESNLDTNGVDRLQSVTNTSSNSNSKRSSHTAIDASKEIATKMLQGWTLLAEHCPRCLNPLMSDTRKQVYCPGCQLWVLHKEREDQSSYPTKRKSSTSTQTSAEQPLSPKEVPDASNKVQVGDSASPWHKPAQTLKTKAEQTSGKPHVAEGPVNDRGQKKEANTQGYQNTQVELSKPGMDSSQVSASISQARNALQCKLVEATASLESCSIDSIHALHYISIIKESAEAIKILQTVP